MKRGLKASVYSIPDSGIKVTAIDPMKRGLKEAVYVRLSGASESYSN